MIRSRYDERFTRAKDENSFQDGSAHSDVGPMGLFGTVAYSSNTERMEKRGGCRWCGRVVVNPATSHCFWHDAHHKKRLEVYAGTLSEADYQDWLQENPAV